MKKPVFAFLAFLACAALVPPGTRAADASPGASDGPDLKETLKWLKRYVTEEASGQSSPDIPAGDPSGLTGPKYAIGYTWTDTTWNSPEEATIQYERNSTDRITGTVTHTNVTLKLKGVDLDKLSCVPMHMGARTEYWVRIPGKEAFSVSVSTPPPASGADVKWTSGVQVIRFATEEPAKKACRALRRAAVLAGAVEAKDPFTADAPKDPTIAPTPAQPIVTLPPTVPPLPIIPSPPDDRAARRAALDGDIAAAADAVSQGQKKLDDLTGNIIAAKLVLVAANAAYNNAESGSFDQVVAGAAVITAQGVVDDLISQKDGVESDLRADRERYNQLKRDRARLGN